MSTIRIYRYYKRKKRNKAIDIRCYDSSAGKSIALTFDEKSMFADPVDIGNSVSWQYAYTVSDTTGVAFDESQDEFKKVVQSVENRYCKLAG